MLFLINNNYISIYITVTVIQDKKMIPAAKTVKMKTLRQNSIKKKSRNTNKNTDKNYRLQKKIAKPQKKKKKN